MQLQEKVAIVLGASSRGGFGESIARRYAEEGAKVVVSARNKTVLEEIATEIGGTAIPCDVTDERQIESLVAETMRLYGKLDVAVCVPGGHLNKPIGNLTVDDIQPLCNMNIIAPTLFIKHCGANMKSGGSIILITSLTAESNRAGTSMYGATKAATEKLAAIAAIEYGPAGIRVNSIAPGVVLTPMAEMMNKPHIIKAFEKETPLGCLAEPRHVAEAALYLASDNCWTTGDLMRVAGGAHLTRLPTAEEILAAAPAG